MNTYKNVCIYRKRYVKEPHSSERTQIRVKINCLFCSFFYKVKQDEPGKDFSSFVNRETLRN